MDTVCYTLCVATPYILCPSVCFEVSPPLQKILDPPLISVSFFHPFNVSAAVYAFISIANLDLGIKTCFYNDMDDYYA